MEKELTDLLIAFFPYLQGGEFKFSETEFLARVKTIYQDREYHSVLSKVDGSLVVGKMNTVYFFGTEKLKALKPFTNEKMDN